MYPTMNTNFYKYGLPESGIASYYDYGHPYEINYHEPPQIEEERRPSNDLLMTGNVQPVASVNRVRERNTNTTTRETPVECKLCQLGDKLEMWIA